MCTETCYWPIGGLAGEYVEVKMKVRLNAGPRESGSGGKSHSESEELEAEWLVVQMGTRAWRWLVSVRQHLTLLPVPASDSQYGFRHWFPAIWMGSESFAPRVWLASSRPLEVNL